MTLYSKRKYGQIFGSKPTLEHLEPRHLLAADVYISEFVASNELLLDEDADDPDWLEIFNAGPDDVNLDSWYLTDDNAQLDKWGFPETVVAAGDSLLVFASGKDRAVAGQPLHTNFKLSAGGEYLGLTRDGEDGTTLVVSAFSPDFPQQTTNVAFGFPQQVDVTEFVTSDSESKLLVPTSEPDASWMAADYDDTAWTTATAAVGYQQTVPGFTIEHARDIAFGFENLKEATDLLDGVGRYAGEETSLRVATDVYPIINFYDAEGGGSRGRFRDGEAPFPGDNSIETLFTEEELAEFLEQGTDLQALRDDNIFAIRASGTITIPETGTWTFNTNSDDGVQVWIDGESIIREDSLHFQGPTDTLAVVELEAGPHSVDLVYFEYVIGATLELSAAPGEFSRFDRNEFILVGDVENGGLPVRTSPSGGDARLAGFVTTDLSESMSNQASSAYLRIPFEIDDPSALETLSLLMRYDDGFVAFLNGHEIARRNAPESTAFDSTSTADRTSVEPEIINITEHISRLQAGNNTLAVQGLNDAADSQEFLISAELRQTTVTRSGTPQFFRDTTPGEFNPATGILEFLHDDVSITQPHGFYDAAFETELVAAQGTSIRYTLDGSLPTVENGIAYEGPISIDKTTTLRARSFKDLAEPSNPATVTYLFISDIVEQPGRPEDWPRGAVNGQTLNYGMDPDITNSDEWGPQLTAALTQVPTMSIVMELDDLVGREEGIYTNAQSHGRDWERPASLELIHPDGTVGFQQEMGIRVRGGFSRSSGNPKHAFRLFFREDYGDGPLEYPLFGDEGADAFQKVDLRTTQNYSWSFNGDGRNTFLRDVFSRDVQNQMGQPYTRSDYYHLYINGQYWGLFQTQERAEARYAASYFGGDADDYDVVKSAGRTGGYTNEATDGTMDAYQRLFTFFQDGGIGDDDIEGYWQAQGMNSDGTRNADFERLLDVDNLIDYMIITYFTSDADGPGSKFTRPGVNNYFGIYNRENPDGFKFFEHDSEHSLDTGNAAGANYNMVTPLLSDRGGSSIEIFNPHWMHEQLAQNNTVYRERFQDAVYNHLFNGGVLTSDRALATLDARAAEIDLAIIAESARWGDAQRSNPYTKNDWLDAVEDTRKWISTRTATVVKQLQDAGWYPTTITTPPQFAVNGNPQNSGRVQPTDELSIVSASALDLETVLEKGSVWRYQDDATDQGTAWRDPGFDDTSWNSGPAKLAYGESDAVTTLNVDGDSNPTVYFRTTFNVDDPAKYVGGLLSLQRDDGAVIYLNGIEIARSNMPSGPIAFDTLASSNVTREEDTFFDIEFIGGGLRAGENTLAVEVHQYRTSSSDLAFDLQLQIGEPSVEVAQIYYTLDGTDPKQVDGTVSATAIQFAGQSIQLSDNTEFVVRLLKDEVWSLPNRTNFVVTDGLLGDVNEDGIVDAADIDALSSAVRNGDNRPLLDLNGDSVTNAADVDFLVDDILQAVRGDVNLDGAVDFSDFLIFSVNFGSQSAGWSVGDTNGDGVTDFEDFLQLSVNFGTKTPAQASHVDRAFAELPVIKSSAFAKPSSAEQTIALLTLDSAF